MFTLDAKARCPRPRQDCSHFHCSFAYSLITPWGYIVASILFNLTSVPSYLDRKENMCGDDPRLRHGVCGGSRFPAYLTLWLPFSLKSLVVDWPMIHTLCHPAWRGMYAVMSCRSLLWTHFNRSLLLKRLSVSFFSMPLLNSTRPDYFCSLWR